MHEYYLCVTRMLTASRGGQRRAANDPPIGRRRNVCANNDINIVTRVFHEGETHSVLGWQMGRGKTPAVHRGRGDVDQRSCPDTNAFCYCCTPSSNEWKTAQHSVTGASLQNIVLETPRLSNQSNRRVLHRTVRNNKVLFDFTFICEDCQSLKSQ